MKKKISQKDWNYIGTHNAGAKWVRPFCVYTLEEVQKGTIKQEVKIGWFGYLLMFIPVHIFKFFWCLFSTTFIIFIFFDFHTQPHILRFVEVIISNSNC